MRVRLIRVPYDAGNRGLRMGAGPDRLAAAADRLRGRGVEVSEAPVEAPPGFRTEIGTTFALHRAVAAEVRGAIAQGAFPVVLSGNCGCAVGALAGTGPGTGIAWFDGHGDFNTPETTASGFLDGMALAVATGRCFGPLARSVPGFSPVPERDAFLVGSRDLDRGEREALTHSEVGWVTVATIRESGAPAALRAALSRTSSLLPKWRRFPLQRFRQYQHWRAQISARSIRCCPEAPRSGTSSIVSERRRFPRAGWAFLPRSRRGSEQHDALSPLERSSGWIRAPPGHVHAGPRLRGAAQSPL